MPPLVGLTVELGRNPAVGFRGNDRLDPRPGQRIAQPVRIERPVGEELAARQPTGQRRRAAQVVGVSGQQADVDEVASAASASARILVLTPPRERPMAWP